MVGDYFTTELVGYLFRHPEIVHHFLVVRGGPREGAVNNVCPHRAGDQIRNAGHTQAAGRTRTEAPAERSFQCAASPLLRVQPDEDGWADSTSQEVRADEDTFTRRAPGDGLIAGPATRGDAGSEQFNMNPAEPLMEFLGFEIPEHREPGCRTTSTSSHQQAPGAGHRTPEWAHVCNWKASVDAFNEVYPCRASDSPQILESIERATLATCRSGPVRSRHNRRYLVQPSACIVSPRIPEPE